MTQRDKLLVRIRSHPKQVRFDDLQTLLSYYGYQLVRVSGSHHRYQREGSPPVTITGMARMFTAQRWRKSCASWIH